MLNGGKKLERKRSGSESELECEFCNRLRWAMGDRSVLSFARECGFSDSLIRKYLSGSLPGLDKAITMARVLGVSLQWLATGEGAPDLGAETPLQASPKAADADLDSLEEVAIKVLVLLDKSRPDLSAKARGRIVRLVYEFYVRQDKPMDEVSLSNVIELAAFR